MLKYETREGPLMPERPTPSRTPPPDPARQELHKAVVDLMRAEMTFTHAYHLLETAPPPERTARQRALDAAERRIEAAEREVQKLQLKDQTE